MIHKCGSVIKGNVGNYSTVYTQLKTGGCGSIVIRTIEESPSNQIRVIWDNWKAVTIFRESRIGKVSHSCEFEEVWIIRLGTWDVSVYTSCYIWSIRNPWDICDFVYIADVWTTVDKDGSCMPTRKNMKSTLVEIYLWAARVLRTEVADLIRLSLWENRVEPDPWLDDSALGICLSQVASSFLLDLHLVWLIIIVLVQKRIMVGLKSSSGQGSRVENRFSKYLEITLMHVSTKKSKLLKN